MKSVVTQHRAITRGVLFLNHRLYYFANVWTVGKTYLQKLHKRCLMLPQKLLCYMFLTAQFKLDALAGNYTLRFNGMWPHISGIIYVT